MRAFVKYGLFLFAAAGSMLAGCQNDSAPGAEGADGGPFRIIATIEGNETVGSRVEKDDFGSYLSGVEGGRFEEGVDQIGFYSLHDEDGEGQGYSNYPLTYSNGSFSSQELGNIEHPGNLGYIFAYYAYEAGNDGSDGKLGIYNADGTVKDVLIAGSAELSSSAVTLAFEHAFSMLFIIPGDGFAEAAGSQDKITVVIREKMQAAIEKNDDGISFVVGPSQDTDIPTEFVARKATDVDLAGQENIPVLYYVILPSNAEVDYIAMENDADEMQYVRPGTALPEKLAQGYRYPVSIRMEGTTPTLWPLTFSEWDSGEDIVLQEDAGIDTPEEFEDWLTAYNAYTGGNTSDETLAELAQYGTRDANDETKWVFRLNADIVCSNLLDGAVAASLVTTLKDTFDGRNHTLSSLNLAGGLIGTVAEGGILTGLNIEGITVTTESTAATGALANSMTGGEITDCSVTDIRMDAKGAVGALVGDATAGTITDNRANGLLFGASSSADRVTGTEPPAGVTCSGNRCSGIIFQSVN